MSPFDAEVIRDIPHPLKLACREMSFVPKALEMCFPSKRMPFEVYKNKKFGAYIRKRGGRADGDAPDSASVYCKQ